MSTSNPSRTTRTVGLLARELRLSLRNNAGAFGYSVMITSSLAALSALHAPPGIGELFLFLIGAVVSFAIIELVATHAFRRALDDAEATTVIALGSSLGVLSIAAAVGVAALCGLLVPEPFAWLAGSFLASIVYILVTAVEMTVARRIEEARDLE
jgi:hypothetical protein